MKNSENYALNGLIDNRIKYIFMVIVTCFSFFSLHAMQKSIIDVQDKPLYKAIKDRDLLGLFNTFQEVDRLFFTYLNDDDCYWMILSTLDTLIGLNRANCEIAQDEFIEKIACCQTLLVENVYPRFGLIIEGKSHNFCVQPSFYIQTVKMILEKNSYAFLTCIFCYDLSRLRQWYYNNSECRWDVIHNVKKSSLYQLLKNRELVMSDNLLALRMVANEFFLALNREDCYWLFFRITSHFLANKRLSNHETWISCCLPLVARMHLFFGYKSSEDFLGVHGQAAIETLIAVLMRRDQRHVRDCIARYGFGIIAALVD